MNATVVKRRASAELIQQLVREVRQQVVQRALAPLVIGAKARPEWSGGELAVDDGRVCVIACSTPLAVREAIADFALTEGAQTGTDTLVVLTDLTEADLGTDILGRFVSPRLIPLNSWKAVCQLLGVRQLDPDYATPRLAWMADALLTFPVDTNPGIRGTLSVDAGLQLLAQSVLGANGITLDRLLVATASPGFADHLARANPELVQRLCTTLGDQLGPAGALVTGAIITGRGHDAVAAGLAAATVAGADTQHYAHAMIEAITGQHDIADAALVAWAKAAGRALNELIEADAPQVPDLVTTGSQFVLDWRAPHPEQSSDLAIGFEARLAALANLLNTLLDDPAAVDLATVREAVDRVRSHRDARSAMFSHRAMRAALAARLALWLHDPISAGHGIATDDDTASFGRVLTGYLADGAWVDAARRRVEEGDDSPEELAAVLSRISQVTYERRRSGNRQFASALATWSEHGTAADMPDAGVMALESVLASIAVPLASSERALLVVLDGCGVAQFLEFVDQFRSLGFQEIGRGGQRATGLAILPTVTEVSRSSLLCGELRIGNAEQEKRGFVSNACVKRLPGPPAQLFHHHQDLVTGAGQGLPPAVLRALGADGPRLVGAVVNTIDDALGRGVFTRELGIENLGPLQNLLRAAADAGRFVIITADHGHVMGVGLDGRGASRRGGDGGDRWRDAERDPDDEDEVLLRGPRVLRGDDRGIIAPSQDDLRYSAKHGGYHGGATPEECLVPLSVFRPPGVDLPTGWEQVEPAPPGWWDLAVLATTAEPPSSSGPRRRRKAATDTAQGDLFGQPTTGPAATEERPQPETTARVAPTTRAAWIDRLVASDTYKVQLGAITRAKPPEDRVIAVLCALDDRGGTASFAVIAQATGMSMARVPGFLSALERLLNVDGYGVITVERSTHEVRLDTDLLHTQFLGGQL